MFDLRICIHTYVTHSLLLFNAPSPTFTSQYIFLIFYILQVVTYLVGSAQGIVYILYR